MRDGKEREKQEKFKNSMTKSVLVLADDVMCQEPKNLIKILCTSGPPSLHAHNIFLKEIEMRVYEAE